MIVYWNCFFFLNEINTYRDVRTSLNKHFQLFSFLMLPWFPCGVTPISSRLSVPDGTVVIRTALEKL